MDNPEKLATYGTQEEEKKQSKNTTQYVEHHYAQTNTNNVLLFICANFRGFCRTNQATKIIILLIFVTVQ